MTTMRKTIVLPAIATIAITLPIAFVLPLHSGAEASGACVGAANCKADISADQIKVAVETDLISDSTLSSQTIHVDVTDTGTVLLSGQLNQEELRDRAGEIAARHAGRDRVINQIQVVTD